MEILTKRPQVFVKGTNVKPVSKLSPDQYRREIRQFMRIVPDATEAQAREAIQSRRRKGYRINYDASATEKSKFRDEFGKQSASARLGQLTKLVKRRKDQNEAGRGDGEAKVSAEGKTVANGRRDLGNMTASQRAKWRKLEAEYWKDYKIAMGYAA